MSFTLPDDSDYFQDRPVPHTAQGDLFDGIPCAIGRSLAPTGRDSGARKRPGRLFGRTDEGVAAVCDPERVLVVVCSYTCGFVAQPPGTDGYSHDHRLVAPIVPLSKLVSAGVQRTEARRARDSGQLAGILRIPPPPKWGPPGGWAGDEFDGHMAVCLWRMTAVSQSTLDAHKRVARLSEAAQRLLVAGLIQVVSPALIDPFDPNLPPPDMSSSWPGDER